MPPNSCDGIKKITDIMPTIKWVAIMNNRWHWWVCVCVCMCVCVCVCVCGCGCAYVCNIRLIDCLSNQRYLRSRPSLSSCPRLYPSVTTTPRSPFLYADNYPSPVPRPWLYPFLSVLLCTPRFSHARTRAVPSPLYSSAQVADKCTPLFCEGRGLAGC